MTWFKRIKGLEWEPEEEQGVHSVLICVLKELHSMLMKITSKLFQVALESLDGKI